MARRLAAIFLFASLTAFAQQKPSPPEPPVQEPEEEDASLKPKEYVFNPIQSASELKIGRFYMKRGSFKAAAGRFEEALRWNPGEAQACILLGEARERLKDAKAARSAYEKCLTMSLEEKDAAEIKRRLKKLS